MVALHHPLTFRWGSHRPLFTTLVVLVPLLLILMRPSSEAAATFDCQLHGPSEVKPKSLYIQDKLQNITLMTSRRIPHQLVTHVVAIFLRRHLGYKSVVLTYYDGFLPSQVLGAMGFHYSPSKGFYIPQDQIPIAIANFEMWTPPNYDSSRYISLTSDNYLGVTGRFGWFMPTYVVEKYGLFDHWRAFLQPDSKASRIFHRSPVELEALDPLLREPMTGSYHCSDARCERGIYTPPPCQDNVCSVLFASHFNQSHFLIDHVYNMSLMVRVAWLGDNLDLEFLRLNFNYSGGRSILFFHFTPDVLIQPFDLTSVAFPSCADHVEYLGMGKLHFCIYELHHFNKIIWSDLKKSDSSLYKSLMRIAMTSDNYYSLIQEYNHNPSQSIEGAACSWMKKDESWKMWINGQNKPALFMVAMFPIMKIADRGKFLAPGNAPAFNLAVEAINRNSSILPDHFLDAIIQNTGCEPDVVMLEFIKIIQHFNRVGSYSKIVGIVGPACSDTVEPLAGVSKHFNIPIISYGAEGALFSDREQYPYFYRTIPENKIFRHVYLKLLKEFKWDRVTSLTEDGHQYSEYLTPLHDLLQENGIVFNMRKYPQSFKPLSIPQYLTDLKKQNYRIIIGDFYEKMARFVLCEAYHLGMTGHEEFVWFIPRWLPDNWYDVDYWNQNSEEPVHCTTGQMLKGLQGHMSLSYKYYADDNDITPENITVREWRQKYREAAKRANLNETDYAGFTYDAVWTYALALDKLFKEDDSYTSNLRSKNTTERFIHYINNTNFDGVSGHINFTNGPSRVTDIVIWQFINRTYNQVGRFYLNSSDPGWGRLELKMDRLLWPNGRLPKDGSKECVVESLRALLGEDMTCNTAIAYVCITGFLALVISLLIIVLVLKRRYDSKLRAMEEMWKDQSIFKMFEGWEIPRRKVVINRKLGKGQFGTVYGGECHFETGKWSAVAVKTLKMGSTASDKLDFLSEAEMMKNFDHENIVKLLGVCTDNEPIYTIMEFMLYGDLQTYLLARRHLVNERTRDDEHEVSNRRLTSMALDVSRALTYLAEMKYVHRDVACRNCLVNAHRSVKLGDFGMTRPINEKNYYRFSRKGLLPVRWMAPESVVDGVFTASSDIWSYGVLLYEIITFGAIPFQGLNNNQVLEKVKSGHTLPLPLGLLPPLEHLLQACWHIVPSNRLTAPEIALYLENNPRLISPSLEPPQPSLPIQESAALELRIPEKSRKLSLSLNSRAMLPPGVGATPAAGIGGGGRRKRSMSGNMVMTLPALTSSLSDDAMLAPSNLEALNLNQVMIEEVVGRDMGEDPLLPHSQYISSSRFLSLSQREIERAALRDAFGMTRMPKDTWTNITPV